ncbi:MAG: YfhO family protein, partial [Oscillospiraceae bacterium]
MLRKLLKSLQKVYALPLLLSLGMVCFVYLASGLFPFGTKTLAWGDMTQQVLPFMMQFKDIAAGNTGLLFNMANAGGMNFWGVFLFFISSPFTALGLLVPRSGFYAFANVLVLLKIVLASCAATAFFSSRYAFFKCEKWQAGLLGVLYAFGGFTLLYYQNVVWLDQLILFPLLMLCFNLLIQKGRVVPFALLLAVGIFGQFQIAYTVILAVLLSGGLHILFYVQKAQRRAAALHLGLAVLLAVGLSAVAWLPAFFQYQQSARRGSLIDNLATTKLLAPVETTLLMLLCTSAVLGGIVFLLFRRRAQTPMVGYCVTCLCLFTIPLLVDPVNLVWHAGSYQAFPSRYGFIPLFFALMLVSAAFQNTAPVKEPAKSKPEGIVLAAAGLALYFFFLLHILLFYRQQAGVYVYSLWGNMGSLAWALCCFALGGVLFFLLLAARAKKYLSKRVFAVVLCCFVAVEGLYNGLLYMCTPANETESFSMAMDLAEKLPESTG